MWAWGRGNEFQLGLGDSYSRFSPRVVPGIPFATKVFFSFFLSFFFFLLFLFLPLSLTISLRLPARRTAHIFYVEVEMSIPVVIVPMDN